MATKASESKPRQGGRGFRDREPRERGERGDGERRENLRDKVKIVIPETLKKADKPDEQAHEKKRQEISTQIETKQKEFDALNAKLTALREERQTRVKGAEGGERGALSKKITDLKKERQELQNQMNTLKAKSDEQNEQMKTVKAKLPEKFDTVEDLDAKVKELEKKIESGSMSITDEKKTLSSISTLKAGRKEIKNFGDLKTSTADIKKQMNVMHGKIQEKQDEISKLVAEQNALYEEGKKKQEANTAERAKVDDMYATRTKLKTEIDALYTQRKTEDQEYRVKNNEWYTYQKEVKKLKDIEYDRLRKERDEEYRTRKEREQLTKVPLGKDIEDCDRLLVYLKGLKPKEAVTQTAPVAAPSKPSGDRANATKQAEILMPRDETDTFSFGKKAKSKKAKATTETEVENKPKTIIHSLDALQLCGKLEVTPPIVSSEVADAITAVATKKNVLEERSKKLRENKLRKYFAKYNNIPEGVVVPEGFDLKGAIDETVEPEPEEVEEKPEESKTEAEASPAAETPVTEVKKEEPLEEGEVKA